MSDEKRTSMVSTVKIPDDWLSFGGRKSDVKWQAKWIWMDGPASPRNVYICARRDFTLEEMSGPYRLHITADTRYRLYINGEWIGDGPARSFYWAQQFDTYDLNGLLRAGKNTIAVLVSHYGQGTFQYDPSGQAGLLVQIERKERNRWQPVMVSDSQWLMQRHEGYLRPTMRISCQMPFEEIVDARKFPLNWMESDGGLPDGKQAAVLGPVGMAPWSVLVARSVPFFTREPIPPVRLFRTQLTEMPNFHTGFTARPYLIPGYKMQNIQQLRGFAATIIESPTEQSITLYTLSGRFEEPIINGQVAESGKPVKIHQGQNLCVVAFQPGVHHEFDRSYTGFVAQPIELRGVFNDQTAWTIFGPFDDYRRIYELIRKLTKSSDLEAFRRKAQVVRQEDILTNGSPWNESTAARRVSGQVQVENLEALFNPGSEVAIIYPSEQGDTELFLDFGRELVGQIELDLQAPAGAVLTFNFLEEIEDEERIHYTYGNHNAFRYITTEGRQRFTSFLRRGYRYCKLIVSDMTGPVRLRSVRTIFSTHPVNHRGSFSCSDALLTDIWRVGRHTLRCCSEDTFTDCPTYEQTYWVGDARNEAMINYAAFGDTALTRRCAELPALSLHRQLITESQVPSAWDNLLTAWSMLWVQMVEEHYQFSGDREYLQRIYPAVRLSLRNCREKLTDQRGLLSIGVWNMFDWAGQDSNHRVVTHNQMFLVEALRRAEYMAQELGKDDEANFFSEYRQELIEAINQHLWDEQRGAYVDALHDNGKQSPVISQQTNSLAISYGLAPPERAVRIKDVPVHPPEEMVKVGSPFALFYILEALAKQERHAELLAVVREQWGRMIRCGATSFWEMFPGYDPQWWTRSYCHAWSAAPTYFLSRYQLGAWWAEPGYKTARIAPVPLDLTWARGTVPTPHGVIHVAWERSEAKFVIQIQLPDGVAGIVELPVPAEEYTKIEAEGLSPKQVNGRWQVAMPAGSEAIIKASK